jgi:SET domain-containing protein
VIGRGLAVQESRHGRGVFALRRFAKGDPVEVCPILEVPEDDVTGQLADYVFSSLTEGNVLLLLGFGMLYNHSHRANLEYVQDEDTMTFLATRTVKRGDELTIDYGEDWWEERGQAPD